jgi:hypothetical protein
MPRHELARLKLMRQPMRSRVAQIVEPCEKSGLELPLKVVATKSLPTSYWYERLDPGALQALIFPCAVSKSNFRQAELLEGSNNFK